MQSRDCVLCVAKHLSPHDRWKCLGIPPGKIDIDADLAESLTRVWRRLKITTQYSRVTLKKRSDSFQLLYLFRTFGSIEHGRISLTGKRKKSDVLLRNDVRIQKPQGELLNHEILLK